MTDKTDNPSDRVTLEEIQESRRICVAATEDPWRANCFMVVATSFGGMYGGKEITHTGGHGNKSEQAEADASFIAHARQALPRYLDMCERLMRENERLNHLDMLVASLQADLKHCKEPVWQSCETCAPVVLDETGKCPKCQQVYDFKMYLRRQDEIAALQRDNEILIGMLKTYPTYWHALHAWTDEEIAAELGRMRKEGAR